MVLLHGSFQTAPSPVITVNGTIFRSMEDSSVPGVGAFVMWAAAGSDLLQPGSWERSSSTVPTTHCAQHGTCLQEGSVVEAPSGEVWNLLRVNSQSKAWHNKLGIAVLDFERKQLRFREYVDGPFGSSKFVVRREPAAAAGTAARPTAYYAVSTNVTDEAAAVGAIGARNNLVLSTSTDLRGWRVCRTLLRDDTGFTAADSARYTGFE